jgi:hypothetical protein
MGAEAIWLISPERDGCVICHQDHQITPETHPEVWVDASGKLASSGNGEQR